MSVPSGLLYTSDHEWVRINGNVARIGITHYAQDALGDIVYIQLPEVGSTVSAHDPFSEIESTKSVNDVYAPVTGTVSAANEMLVGSPELLNNDPYGDGWICEITMDTAHPEGLLGPDEYSQLIG
ncbi:MAG: glycine cleavage complex protein carrier of aminomethyl moiety via covalently bound lipoyl [Actinomycetota bacterium]